jgi:hypothetical protein
MGRTVCLLVGGALLSALVGLSVRSCSFLQWISSDHRSPATGLSNIAAQSESISTGKKPRFLPWKLPIIRVYRVPGGQAEDVTPLLRDVYRRSPDVFFFALGKHAVLVIAPPDDQLEIEDQLR